MRGAGSRAALRVLATVAFSLIAARAVEADGVRTRLPSGLTVLVTENHAAPLVAASLFVRVGARWESEDNAGITNVLQHLLLRGTRERSALQIAVAAEQMGGTISASSDADFAEIRGVALGRQWRALLELISDVGLHPSLLPDELAAERRQALRAIRNRQDQPGALALDTALGQLYGPHPYGRPPLGRPASVAGIDEPALRAYYERYFRTGRMILSVSGDVSAADVVAEAARLFAAAPTGDGGPDAAGPAVTAAPGRLVVTRPAAQAQVLMAFIAPPIGHRDYAAVKVLVSALGGGMGSRLFRDLRDRHGLVYSTAAVYPSRVGPAYVLAASGTAPANALRVEEEMRGQIERLRDGELAATELERAKRYLLGQFALDRRTNERLAWYAGFFELSGVGHDFDRRYLPEVETVTAAQVRRAATRYLGAPTVVTLGPMVR